MHKVIYEKNVKLIRYVLHFTIYFYFFYLTVYTTGKYKTGDSDFYRFTHFDDRIT